MSNQARFCDAAIFGIGGHGREIAWLLQFCRGLTQSCFVCDGVGLPTHVNGVRLLSWDEFRSNRPCGSVIVAIGDPDGRESVVSRAQAAGFAFPRVVHDGVHLSNFVELGDGVVICEGTVLTVNIRIGPHVHVNRACSISHDVSIGEFSTLSPGVNVSGHVRIGARVFIGSGVTIANGSVDHPLLIPDGTVVGAGACVTKSIPAPGTYVGVPARRI